MIAETRSILKVTGRSMAMVPTGPNPGKTPMAVPKVTPMKQYRRFEKVRLIPKPSLR
jgi:hypothetical protein